MTKALCRECGDRKHVNCFLLLSTGSYSTICKGCIEQARIDRAVELGAPERNDESGFHDRVKTEGALAPIGHLDDLRYAHGAHLYAEAV